MSRKFVARSVLSVVRFSCRHVGVHVQIQSRPAHSPTCRRTQHSAHHTPYPFFSSAVAKPSIEPKRISCAFVSPLPVLPQIHSYLLSVSKEGKVKGRKG